MLDRTTTLFDPSPAVAEPPVARPGSPAASSGSATAVADRSAAERRDVQPTDEFVAVASDTMAVRAEQARPAEADDTPNRRTRSERSPARKGSRRSRRRSGRRDLDWGSAFKRAAAVCGAGVVLVAGVLGGAVVFSGHNSKGTSDASLDPRVKARAPKPPVAPMTRKGPASDAQPKPRARHARVKRHHVPAHRRRAHVARHAAGRALTTRPAVTPTVPRSSASIPGSTPSTPVPSPPRSASAPTPRSSSGSAGAEFSVEG